jgi:hypothetical protein
MSKRQDIIDGKAASAARSGLVYTCQCGWIDLGHARPDNARELWRDVVGETGSRSPNGLWYRLRFEECMAKWGIRVCKGERFAVRLGLNLAQQESVALAIFLRVSVSFEAMQANWLFGRITDSGFSAEDLVSNLVGFYRAVRSGPDYISFCQPVSKSAAEAVWDSYGAVGAIKNYSPSPFLFPCRECTAAPSAPVCTRLPKFLKAIALAEEGKWFRVWRDGDPVLTKPLPAR